MKKYIPNILAFIFLLGFTILMARLTENKPDASYATGYIPATAKPTLKWVRGKNGWASQLSIPVIIQNSYRGEEISVYIDQDELSVGWDTWATTVFKDSYPPAKNKPVFVAMRQIDDGWIITRASFDKNAFIKNGVED